MPEKNLELERYRAEGANLLVPSTQFQLERGAATFLSIAIDSVRLDPDPDGGDVYDPKDDRIFLRDKNGRLNNNKKLRITKQGLNRLANTACVIWSPSQCHPITDRSNPRYVAYRAVGGIRKPDGQPLFYSDTYDMDLNLEEEKLRDKYDRQADQQIPGTNPPKLWRGERTHAEYVDYCTRRDLFQKRSNALKLCESGAKNRVLREVLGLKNHYTVAELSNPFVMARIVFQPDYNDPAVKARLLDAYVAAMTGVYGSPSALPSIASSNQSRQSVVVPDFDADPIDVIPIDKDTPPPDEEPVLGVAESAIIDYGNASDQEQLRAVTDIAAAINYDLPGYLARAKLDRVEDLPTVTRGTLFAHLAKIAYKEEL